MKHVEWTELPCLCREHRFERPVCLGGCDRECLSLTDHGKREEQASAGSLSHHGEASDAQANRSSGGTATAEAHSVGRG